LVDRNGLSFEEAYETLRTNFHVTESRQELEAIVARLPCRIGRPVVEGGSELPDNQASQSRTDAHLLHERAVLAARRWKPVILSTMASLPAQDRIILRMRFRDDVSIADVARILHLEQKRLHRHFAKVLDQLREKLQAAGLTAEDLRDLFDSGGFDW